MTFCPSLQALVFQNLLNNVHQEINILLTGFDPLAMELFGSTMVGARLIIGDDEIRLSSEKLIEFLTINEVVKCGG